MIVRTFAFGSKGWSQPLPRELDGEETLVLAFADPRFADDPVPLHEISAAFSRSRVIGCSTAGQIDGAKVFDGGIVVAVVRFEHTRLRQAWNAIAPGEASFDAGTKIATVLDAPDLHGVIVLSEGLQVNGSELVRGINSVVAPSVLVAGGLAADGERFQRTWTLRAGEAATGHVCAVGLYGDRIRFGHGSKGGWDIFGPERRITRSQGNVLYELDGKPALALYKEYLGERAQGLPSTALLFPLALRPPENREDQVVRTVLAVDESSQSLTFAGDVPAGWLAQLMKCNFDRLVQGASDAAASAAKDLDPSAPTLAIAISCVGRRLVLGERIEEEVDATREALPSGAIQIGFYSYGELSPLGGGSCDLHNQTMTMFTLQEV